MSNLMSYLNPKTNSFEVGTGKSVNVITPSDIAAALSYSQMPAISHDLIRAKFLAENSVKEIEAIAIALMSAHYPVNRHSDLLKVCAVVAVVEFCCVPADYKSSGYKRAVMLGVSERTYRRLNLSIIIAEFGDKIAQYYAIGRAKLGRQFASLRNGLIYAEDLDVC